MKPYPKYKDSRVEWLGEVPVDWGVCRTKLFFSVRSERGSPKAQLLSVYRDYGVIPRDSRDDNFNRPSEDLANYKVVRVGDLVVNKMKAWQGSLGISDFDGIVSPAYLTFSPRQKAGLKYFHHLLRSPLYAQVMASLSQGIRPNQWDLDADDLARLPTLVPTPDERVSIVRFLDAKTAQIDELMEKKRRQIELLKEYRASVISEAVTKGLNPNVRMKDSGVEWIGQIPEHWVVGWLKHLFAFEKGKNAQIYTQEFIADHPGEYPVFSGQTENEGVMGLIDRHEYDTKEIIFVTTVGARAMTTRLVSGKYALSQNCALIIPRREELNVRYYHGLLQMMFAYEKGRISLIMQPSLRFEDMVKYWAFIPPKEEQDEIAKFIVDQNAKIDFLLSKEESQIAQLQSYRTSLISEAVTGKIDVRDWAEAG